MNPRSVFVALAVASLFVLPDLASAAIVQKWQSTSTYYVLSFGGDLNGNGTFQMITAEIPPAGQGVRIGIRSAASGALLAQSAGVYMPIKLWLGSIDPDGTTEIIFADTDTDHLVCLSYTVGQITLGVRWSFLPTPQGLSAEWEFVDFDGNGQLFMVFADELQTNTFYVRNNTGALVSTIIAPSAPAWSSQLEVNDYDVDGRQELMIDFRPSSGPIPHSQDVLYVYESNAPAPQAILASGASDSRLAQRPRAAIKEIDLANSAWSSELDARAAARGVRLP
jgi:hypothetical protein